MRLLFSPGHSRCRKLNGTARPEPSRCHGGSRYAYRIDRANLRLLRDWAPVEEPVDRLRRSHRFDGGFDPQFPVLCRLGLGAIILQLGELGADPSMLGFD